MHLHNTASQRFNTRFNDYGDHVGRQTTENVGYALFQTGAMFARV